MWDISILKIIWHFTTRGKLKPHAKTQFKTNILWNIWQECLSKFSFLCWYNSETQQFDKKKNKDCFTNTHIWFFMLPSNFFQWVLFIWQIIAARAIKTIFIWFIKKVCGSPLIKLIISNQNFLSHRLKSNSLAGVMWGSVWKVIFAQVLHTLLNLQWIKKTYEGAGSVVEKPSI